MEITINTRSNVAVFMQIVNQIKFAIAAGELNERDKIHSVRELSDMLDVNPNTVAKSYRDLEVMGYVYTRRGMGVFIQKNIRANCIKDCQKYIAQKMFEVVSEGKATGIPKSFLSNLLNDSFSVEQRLYEEMPKSVFK